MNQRVANIQPTPAKCDLCGCEELSIAFTLPVLDGPYGSEAGWNTRSFFQCQDCGFTFVHPFEPERYSLHYSTLDETYHVRHDEDTSRYRMVIRQLDLSKIKRLLDWGCGAGTFLSSLPPSTEKFGVELCASAAAKARQIGIKIVSQTEMEEDGLARSFDAVTAIDVAEHLPNLVSFRRTVATLLRPGGSLLVLTGNLDSRAARTLGRHWYYLHSAEHVSFLTGSAVRAWLAPEFEDIQIKPVTHHEIRGTDFVKCVIKFCFAWLLEEFWAESRFRISSSFPATSDHMLVRARRRDL